MNIIFTSSTLSEPNAYESCSSISGVCLCVSTPYAFIFSFTSQKRLFTLAPLPAPETPDFEEQLSYASGSSKVDDVKIIFTPHLAPMNRGILVTGYANLKRPVDYDTVRVIYEKYYKDEKFVRILNKDVCPETKWVEGSNYFDVNFKIDDRTNRIVVMGALDNIVKGAAGQAVQNMNIVFGFDEDMGLNLVPMFP